MSLYIVKKLNKMHSVILQYAQQLVTVTAFEYIDKTDDKNLVYNFSMYTRLISRAKTKHTNLLRVNLEEHF